MPTQLIRKAFPYYQVKKLLTTVPHIKSYYPSNNAWLDMHDYLNLQEVPCEIMHLTTIFLFICRL